jgi:hypothetical protein
VRVNNVDLFPSHKLVQFACTLNVERIPQRHYQDLLGRQLQMTRQRRSRPHGNVNIVISRNQRIREINNVTLAATKGRR